MQWLGPVSQAIPLRFVCATDKAVVANRGPSRRRSSCVLHFQDTGPTSRIGYAHVFRCSVAGAGERRARSSSAAADPQRISTPTAIPAGSWPSGTLNTVHAGVSGSCPAMMRPQTP
jgi:hypothetical protein